jgi:hypothetical protein
VKLAVATEVKQSSRRLCNVKTDPTAQVPKLWGAPPGGFGPLRGGGGTCFYEGHTYLELSMDAR